MGLMAGGASGAATLPCHAWPGPTSPPDARPGTRMPHTPCKVPLLLLQVSPPVHPSTSTAAPPAWTAQQPPASAPTGSSHQLPTPRPSTELWAGVPSHLPGLSAAAEPSLLTALPAPCICASASGFLSPPRPVLLSQGPASRPSEASGTTLGSPHVLAGWTCDSFIGLPPTEHRLREGQPCVHCRTLSCPCVSTVLGT